MKPKRILIARHGESVGNVNKGAYATTPDYALPLTPRGVSQAAELGTEIRRLIAGEKIRFYVSPWRRTRETFMGAVSALDANQWTAAEDPRLREQEWGHLRHEEATKILEQERDAYGTFYYRFDDGESGADVYDRCSALLETVHRDFREDTFPPNCAFIGHGLTNRLLVTRWLHWTPEQFEQIANPENCELWVMDLQADGHYQMTTPLRTEPVGHQNIAVPPGYEKLLPPPKMPTAAAKWPLCEEHQPHDITPEPDAPESAFFYWPGHWPGHLFVDLDSLGDPGAWLEQQLSDIEDILAAEPEEDASTAKFLADEYIRAADEMGFPLPSDFEGTLEETRESAITDFIGFIREWRKIVQAKRR
jgi:broad specificity phosphatase PhoE